jgi:hypothetical protein
MLFPGASKEFFLACGTHDAGEHAVGDMPYTRKSPEFAAVLDAAEAEVLADMGLDFGLTATEIRRLKLVDRLDAYLFAKHRRPGVLTGDGWPEQREWLAEECIALLASGYPLELLQ